MKIRLSPRHIITTSALLLALAGGPTSAWAASELSVNINTASAEQISEALNGVGIKRAQEIVKWREKNGDFSSINQLTEIKGIGSKILAKNSDRITIE